MSAEDHERAATGGLESPFFTDELFADEAVWGASPRLSLLQGESPFRHAFQPFAESLTPAAAPGIYEEGTELAGEAADASPELEEQVLTLPAGLPALPSDAALRGQLQANGTAEARALDAAFAAFGDPAKFINRLPPALNAAFEPFTGPQQRFRVHVARLGAEAFVLNTPMEPDGKYVSYVDHPDHLASALTDDDKRNFVHFAMRRLLQISPIVVKPQTHRRQMSRAVALFRLFQTELTRNLVFRDNTFPLAYRTLSVQLIWRHYQGLRDQALETAAKTSSNWAALRREWEDDLKVVAVTQLPVDADARVPTFRLTPAIYRDYFKPSAASDIGFQHYTPGPPPAMGDGPEMPYRAVFRRRLEQQGFIEFLRRERETDPLPKLHDNASWQAWVRKTWDSPLLRKETKLEAVLKYVGAYFHAFTVHAPHDIREGCSVPNYLTRAFPRAITGSLTHDCLVYAVRWLHILGRLLSPGSLPAGIANPRIFLVEMPAHVGVMIRAEAEFNRHVVVSINNKDAKADELDGKESDEKAAQAVVFAMYEGPRTPYVVRPLKSKPADAKALWNEVCKLAEKKLSLPYHDAKFPPHLRYLKYNAVAARISRELSAAVVASWIALLRRLEAAKPGGGGGSFALVGDEIRRHAENFERAVPAAAAKFASETKPLIQEINDDLAANGKRVPKGVSFAETSPRMPFLSAALKYREALKTAISSRDLTSIDPADFFPEDDFAPEFE